MMKNNIDWIKILRYLSGDCTADEELEMTEWMSSSVENEEFMLFLETIWQMEPTDQKKIDEDSAWERFNQKYQYDIEDKPVTQIKPNKEKYPVLIEKKSNSKSMAWLSFAGVAASILIAIVFTFQVIDLADFTEENIASEEIEYREVRTDKGERSRITLSDGSMIHLNGDSYLRIPKVFSNENPNTVYLEGEAYFDIIRNEYNSFHVIAGETVTTVLGTRFNVRLYPEESDVTVVVTDGMVSLGFLNDSEFEPAILTKHQKGVIGLGSFPIISDISDLSVYNGWIDGDLVFDHEPLSQMITKLERWFGIEIETTESGLEIYQKRLTASYSERQPVEDVLQSISLVLDLSFDKSDISSNRYKLYNKQ